MTMNKDSDSKQASANDVRITPIGRFLRKSNLDEFPQFFNVFIGQMSVVGPRPHMLKHTEQYSVLIEYYRVRHYVKPGITGWAQVNGYRGETDELWKMEKRVEYDMLYLNNWTFWWDLRIILMTFFGKNALKNAG
jgi:putative colanic acid biosynthesis UDP-glucose lipid carrier transferase